MENSNNYLSTRDAYINLISGQASRHYPSRFCWYEVLDRFKVLDDTINEKAYQLEILDIYDSFKNFDNFDAKIFILMALDFYSAKQATDRDIEFKENIAP